MRLIVFLFLVASTPAWAQPPGVQPPLQPAAPVESKALDKSPRLAGWLSFSTTAAGVTTLIVTFKTYDQCGDCYDPKLPREARTPLYIAGAALLFAGPSTGQLYAGNFWNRGLAVRTVSGVILVSAISGLRAGTDGHGLNGGALGLGAVAGVVFVGGAIYEIATAPRAARRYNERHAAPTLTIAPLLSREPGLALAGRF